MYMDSTFLWTYLSLISIQGMMKSKLPEHSKKSLMLNSDSIQSIWNMITWPVCWTEDLLRQVWLYFWLSLPELTTALALSTLSLLRRSSLGGSDQRKRESRSTSPDCWRASQTQAICSGEKQTDSPSWGTRDDSTTTYYDYQCIRYTNWYINCSWQTVLRNSWYGDYS